MYGRYVVGGSCFDIMTEAERESDSRSERKREREKRETTCPELRVNQSRSELRIKNTGVEKRKNGKRTQEREKAREKAR